MDIYAATNETVLPQIESFKNTSYLNFTFDRWLPYYLFASLIVCWEARRMIVIFIGRCPKNVKITGPSSIIGNWLTSVRYCYAAQSVHNEAYAKADGNPYAIPARRRYHVCVSSQKLVEELGQASIHQVSLRDALWERAFPEQTIDGLKVDKMDNHGSLSQKVFRHKARQHLPSMQPVLENRVGEAFNKEVHAKLKTKGWTKFNGNGVVSRITGRINNVILVGDELAQNEEFFENTMRYLDFAGACEEILQFTPKFLFSTMSWLLMRATGATQNVMKAMLPLVEKRLQERESGNGEEHKDTIQWIMDSRKKVSAYEIAQQTLSYVFGGAYQMPMLICFSLYNLCRHPEYLGPLREELKKSGGIHFNLANNECPLLDSFLKETARLNPVTIFGMPRKIMSPFTFSDGTHVPANNWVVVPQQAMMKDANNYSEPHKFNGFRFVKDVSSTEGEKSESRLSHPSWRFPFWGSVKQACPARFYVADMSKMIIAKFIMEYDIKLADEKIPDSFAWGVIRVPHPRLAFLLKKRDS